MNQFDESNLAETTNREASVSQRSRLETLQKLATTAALNRNLTRAIEHFSEALEISPHDIETLSGLASSLDALGRHEEALERYDQALALTPDRVELLARRGSLLRKLARFDDALENYQHALRLEPDHKASLSACGHVFQALRRYPEALEVYGRALALLPNDAYILNNIGTAWQALDRKQDALDNYGRSIQANPNNALVFKNRGALLQAMNRQQDALEDYEHALKINPNNAEILNNRGLAFQALHRHREALASYDLALGVKPDFPEVLVNRGTVLRLLQRFPEALASYQRALSIRPDISFLLGDCVYIARKMCAWDGLEASTDELLRRIERRERASTAFPLVAISDSRALQRTGAEIFARSRYSPDDTLPPIPKYPRHERIRIGYFSADFHNHATSRLMARLFELHDKTQFELIAFSFGPSRNDDMRRRIVASFDRFIEVQNLPDKEVAKLARRLEIDLAIDLKGHTQDSRVGIFAFRAAPLQVNYLGFPGTMGCAFIDYLIADPVLIPVSHQPDYAEKIVYLPDCYQVNDDRRTISERAISRTESGLPETGFVFCCFNGSYKITPGMFDCWMRILERVEDSVLWLLEDNLFAQHNLRSEAQRRGVSGDRLIFARRISLAEHLARHRCADLFLDTLPCNAHTTASDSLWAGLPLLTCPGATFASRVAASLLTAIGLPELIAADLNAYESLAIELATNSEKLSLIRQKLSTHRLASPLFDTERFTRHLETAYREIFRNYHEDKPPRHLHVETTGNSEPTTGEIEKLLAFFQQQRFAEGESIARTLGQRFPRSGFVWKALGAYLTAQGKRQEAVEPMRLSAKFTPDDAENLCNLGITLIGLERWQEAEPSFRRALSLHPDYWEADKGLKIALAKQDKLL